MLGKCLKIYQAMYCVQASCEHAAPARLLPTARKLDKLLSELEGKLTKASLSQKQQHWVMFTVLPAYLCRRQCFEAMCDERRLPQVSLGVTFCPAHELYVCYHELASAA